MGWFGQSDKGKQGLNWERLNSSEQLELALSPENDTPVLIFKHSTRCSISSMALSRFEKEWNSALNCRLLYLDLLEFRPISNLVAERTGVLHQSPQAILIHKGKVLYHASHNGINAVEIENLINHIN